MGPVLVAVAAPLVLVLVALLLATLRERSGPCRPRGHCGWGFLSAGRSRPAQPRVAVPPPGS